MNPYDYERLGYLTLALTIWREEAWTARVGNRAGDLLPTGCAGMTGSGRIWLCTLKAVSARRHPGNNHRPKGDMLNLLLTFPNLEPQDFRRG